MVTGTQVASTGFWPTDGIYDGGLPVQEILGLPVHPLVVYAAVVLLPLTALGLMLVALSHRLSKRYSALLVLMAGLAAISAVLATFSGRTFQKQLGYGQQEHFAVGGWLPWFGLALVVCTFLLWILDRQTSSRGVPGKILAVAAILIAIASIGATVYIGYLGAELTWSNRV